MTASRKVIKSSKVYRQLIKRGVDRRQMLRQLSRLDSYDGKARDLIFAFTFEHTPQGFKYWDKVCTAANLW